MLDKFFDRMDILIATLKDEFQQQIEVLQEEFFEMRRDLEKERTRRLRLEETNREYSCTIACINSVQSLREKVDNLEQSTRNDDVVLDLKEPEERVSDPRSTFLTNVNKVLMGNIIAKDDIKNVSVIHYQIEIKYLLFFAEKDARKAIPIQTKLFKNQHF